MKVELIVDREGRPNVIPDDFYDLFGKPLADWLAGAWTVPSDCPTVWAAAMAERCAAYAQAHRLYLEAAKSIYQKHGDALRHRPWVIAEYDSVNEGLTKYLFIFKADNNGNTYRIRYTPQLG